MSLPVYLHSAMTGAPSLTPTNGSINALLNACLVNGFNTQSVVSATAASGVVTFNFASAPGFSALDTVTIAGASNGTVNGQKRVQSASGNQVLVDIPGVPDGAVGGTITLKFSPLGWTRPYSGTNLGAYRQGGSASHKRFLRVYDGTLAADYLYYVRGYENMTAISTGTGAFPTTAQIAGNGVTMYGCQSAVQAWFIVGTPRFFYLFIGHAVDATGNLGVLPRNSLASFNFGELADVQKATDTYAYIIPSNYTGIISSQYMPRAYTGTGTAIGANPVSYGGLNTTSFGLAAPDPGSGHIVLAGQPFVYDPTGSQSLRGFLPGALSFMNSPIGGGSMLPRDVLTGITGVTGRVLLGTSYGATATYDIGLMLDEDWGDT